MAIDAAAARIARPSRLALSEISDATSFSFSSDRPNTAIFLPTRSMDAAARRRYFARPSRLGAARLMDAAAAGIFARTHHLLPPAISNVTVSLKCLLFSFGTPFFLTMDAAAAGILRGQVDWRRRRSGMPPRFFPFRIARFFLSKRRIFSSNTIDGRGRPPQVCCEAKWIGRRAIDGRGAAGIYARPRHLLPPEISYATSVFFGVHTFFFQNAFFSPDAIDGCGRCRYFARPS